MFTFSLVATLLIAIDKPSEAELDRFLPTLDRLSTSVPGASFVYEVKGPPSPTPLGRTFSIRLFRKDNAEWYVKEEADTYSCAIALRDENLLWHYISPPDDVWFLSRLKPNAGPLPRVLRQKQFACCDFAGIATTIRTFVSQPPTTVDDMQVNRVANQVIEVVWRGSAGVGTFRLESSIESKTPDWVDAIKTADAKDKPIELDSDFTFMDAANRVAAESSAERVLNGKELAKFAAQAQFPLPADSKTSIVRAVSLQKGQMLLLDVAYHDVSFECLLYRVDFGGTAEGINHVFPKDMVDSRQRWSDWEVLLVPEGDQLSHYCVKVSGLVLKVVTNEVVEDDVLRALVLSFSDTRRS